jgi:predicted nucleic acid-binding protein
MASVSKVTVGTARTVNVRVNTNPATRVRTIQYSAADASFSVSDATDVIFQNTENNLSVLTYDDNIDKFVVQNVPRLNGGTF